MLTIRLQRVGKKNQPYFRIVLIEHTRKVKGIYQELLGHRDPRSKETKLNTERIQYWLSKGVKPSATVHNLLVSRGIITGPKVQAWKPKKGKGGSAAVAEKKEATPETPKTEEKKDEPL